MKVQNYACDICKEKMINCGEFIGFSMNINTSEYYPVPVERANNHICKCCLDSLVEFHEKWERREEMSSVELHAWGLSW